LDFSSITCTSGFSIEGLSGICPSGFSIEGLSVIISDIEGKGQPKKIQMIIKILITVNAVPTVLSSNGLFKNKGGKGIFCKCNNCKNSSYVNITYEKSPETKLNNKCKNKRT
jgi:hypothetical protein